MITIEYGFLWLHSIESNEAIAVKGSTITVLQVYFYPCNVAPDPTKKWPGSCVWHDDTMGHMFLVRETPAEILQAIAESYKQARAR
jgi:hypothetical protein